MQTQTREITKEVFGSLSLVFWSLQLVPQSKSTGDRSETALTDRTKVWKMYKEKSSKGVSGLMMLIWIGGCALYASYAVAFNLAVTLIVQPELFLFFALICYGQCIYYEK